MSNYSGIYIHFPYCASKCGFCDFYSGVFPYHHDYFDLIIKEIQMYESLNVFQDYRFDTLYLGGGTPSFAAIEDLSKLFMYLKDLGILSSFKEITIEANPEDIQLDLLCSYRELGINRISLGIQSFDSLILKNLERRSSVEKNIQAIKWVKQHFSNFSLDFMHGIPDQDLCTELFSYSSMEAPHLSTYGLTIYPGTPFYAKKNSFIQEEDEFLESYEYIHDFFSQLGYHHYEISNFAKPGYESLHNQHYWDQDYYLGLGAGASGYLKGQRYSNNRITDYITKIKEGVFPIQEHNTMDELDLFLDAFILRMRKNQPFTLYYPDVLEEQKIHLLEKYFVDLSQRHYIDYSQNNRIITPTWKTWLISDAIVRYVYNVLY